MTIDDRLLRSVINENHRSLLKRKLEMLNRMVSEERTKAFNIQKKLSSLPVIIAMEILQKFTFDGDVGVNELACSIGKVINETKGD